MLIMPNNDLVLLGYSTDTSLITPVSSSTSRKFLSYFSNDPSILNYKWAVQLPNGLETYDYKNMDIKDDSTSSQFVVMFTKLTPLSWYSILKSSTWQPPSGGLYMDILIVTSSTGIIEKHHRFNGGYFTDTYKGFCIFFNSMVI
jgi:hypothetical protein